MPVKSRYRRRATLGTVMFLMLAVAGCGATDQGDAERGGNPDDPPRAAPVPDAQPYDGDSGTPSAYVDGQDLMLTTYGSSSCPFKVADVREVGSGTAVEVIEAQPVPERACTADFGPTEQRVALGATASVLKRVYITDWTGTSHWIPVAAEATDGGPTILLPPQPER